MHAVMMMPSVVEMILNRMRPTVTPIRVFSSAQHITASTTVIQRRMQRLMFALMSMSSAGFRNGQTRQTSGVHISFFPVDFRNILTLLFGDRQGHPASNKFSIPKIFLGPEGDPV